MLRSTSLLVGAGLVLLSTVACNKPTIPEPEIVQIALPIHGQLTELVLDTRNPQILAETLVESDPTVPVQIWLNMSPSERGVKIRFYVTSDTKIRVLEGNVERDGTLDDLRLGATVAAADDGVIVETGIPQAVAQKILIMD